MDDILRSEAHFAAILYAELRQKSLCGDLLLEKIQALAGEDIGSYEISYVEPAPFRDAWKAMNNSKRLDFLRELTKKIDEDAALDGWIKNDAKGKVRSPASWTSEDKKTIPEKLRKLYWIFRARPDILLLTEKSAIWIELKVFSGEPATKIDGYNQYGTQLDIADLAAIAVPRLDKKIKMNLTIQRSGQPIKNGRKYIMWDAIARPTSVFPKSLFKNFVRSNRKSPPGLS